MSTLQVANVNFESTANNQLVYSANTLTISVGGANVAVDISNSLLTTMQLNRYSIFYKYY
jgi:hypothetical protein